MTAKLQSPASQSRRAFRFGVGPANLQVTPAEWTELARRVEAAGYDTLAIGDHPTLARPAPIASMTAAGVATTRLRVAVHTLGVDFRQPVVLAKELATIDQMTSGRLELGLGAGWLRDDYERAGIPFERPGVRLARLREAVLIWRALMSDGACHLDGEHYQVHIDDFWPLAAQRPTPPLMMGGGGPRMLGLAAELADIVGISFSFASGSFSNWDGSAVTRATVAAKLELVAAAAGSRWEQIELHSGVIGVAVTTDRRDAARRFGEPFGLSPDQVLDSPFWCIGTVAQIVEDLERDREELGLTYVTVPGDTWEAFAPVAELLRSRVRA